MVDSTMRNEEEEPRSTAIKKSIIGDFTSNRYFIDLCGIIIAGLVLTTTILNCRHIQNTMGEGSTIGIVIYIGFAQIYQLFSYRHEMKSGGLPVNKVKLLLRTFMFLTLDPNCKWYYMKEFVLMIPLLRNLYQQGTMVNQI